MKLKRDAVLRLEEVATRCAYRLGSSLQHSEKHCEISGHCCVTLRVQPRTASEGFYLWFGAVWSVKVLSCPGPDITVTIFQSSRMATLKQLDVLFQS